MANICLLFKNSIYLQCLFPVASDSSSYRVWFFYKGHIKDAGLGPISR